MCIYVYVKYVHMCVCMCVHVCVSMYVCICKCESVCAWVCMYVCECVQTDHKLFRGQLNQDRDQPCLISDAHVFIQFYLVHVNQMNFISSFTNSFLVRKLTA